MRSAPAVLLLLLPVFAVRPQIGFYPLKGNMFRAKVSSEISAVGSSAWTDFVESRNLATAASEVTNISYWITDEDDKFDFERERDLCVHVLKNPRTDSDRKLKMYFLCDALCCADECCERDWLMTIVGITCISLFSLTPVFCFISCCIARIQNRQPADVTKFNNNHILYKEIT